MTLFQAMNGMEASGDASEEFWSRMLSRRPGWRRMGDGGRDIRLAQSALVAFGYQEAPVQSRYGVRMNRAIRALRVEKGIRGSTKLDGLVWAALFDFRYTQLISATRGRAACAYATIPELP
jgi:peptidoglycan hydrolase-like protein with peptidoglycan-binding domain